MEKQEVVEQMEMLDLFLEGYTTRQRLSECTLEASFDKVHEDWDEKEPSATWEMEVSGKKGDGWRKVCQPGLLVEASHLYNGKIRVFVNEAAYKINLNESGLLDEYCYTMTPTNEKATPGKRSVAFMVDEIMDVGHIVNYVMENVAV